MDLDSNMLLCRNATRLDHVFKLTRNLIPLAPDLLASSMTDVLRPNAIIEGLALPNRNLIISVALRVLARILRGYQKSDYLTFKSQNDNKETHSHSMDYQEVHQSPK